MAKSIYYYCCYYVTSQSRGLFVYSVSTLFLILAIVLFLLYGLVFQLTKNFSFLDLIKRTLLFVSSNIVVLGFYLTGSFVCQTSSQLVQLLLSEIKIKVELIGGFQNNWIRRLVFIDVLKAHLSF